MRNPAIILLVTIVNFLMLSSCITSQGNMESRSSEQVIVKTHDGFSYDLPWFVIHDSMLISRLNTTRYTFDKQQIIEIARYDPDPQKVDLQTALRHDGSISLVAYDEGKEIRHYQFYDIEENFGRIFGYKYTDDYTADIRIPLSNVKRIEKLNKSKTCEANEEIFYWLLVALEVADAIFWCDGSCMYFH